MTFRPDDLFARAKAEADIIAVAGVKFTGHGWRRRGPCPLCGHGRGRKHGHAFVADIRAKRFECFVCGERGDVIDLERLLHGLAGEAPIEAARRILGERRTDAFVTPVARFPDIEPEGPRFSDEYARTLLRESVPASGTLVQRYLMARGISGRVLVEAVRRLRFHPAAYHSGPRHRAVTHPAMVAAVVVCGADGNPRWTGGAHVTYLRRDGSGKAHVPEGEKAKKMWGRQHLDGLAGGAWLSGIGSDGDLMVAEGIETALSMAMLHDGPARVAAALSLGRLQGVIQKDRFGRIDPDMPRIAADAHAFVWPPPSENPWNRVWIGVDNDMSPLTVKVRAAQGGTTERILGPEERARLCATLSRAAWDRTGVEVRTVAPDAGEDFNDKLQRILRDRVSV